MFENLCEFIKNELKELDRKVASGGKLSMQEIEFADKIAHIKKSILTIDAMENPEQYRESGYGVRGNYRDGYNDGYSDAYGRRGYSEDYSSMGRGSNAQRDSMGRYTYYPHMYRDNNMMGELEDLEKMAPNEQMRRRVHEFAKEIKDMM